MAQARAEQRQRANERRRHLPPVELEKQQVILEPPNKLCPVSGDGQRNPRAFVSYQEALPFAEQTAKPTAAAGP